MSPWEAVWLELRAAARALVTGVSDWLTQGFDTVDLGEAHAFIAFKTGLPADL